jgi:hypothetical protein
MNLFNCISRALPRCLALFAAGVLIATVPACASFSDEVGNGNTFPWTYKVNVVQGNFVSKEQFQALKAGMPSGGITCSRFKSGGKWFRTAK